MAVTTVKNTIHFGRRPRRTGWAWGAALAVAAGFGLLGAPQASMAADDQATAPAYSKKGADTCLNCHDDANLAGIFKTKHGQPGNADAPFGHGQLQCEACHGPGGKHATTKGKDRPAMIKFGSKSGTPVAQQNQQCLTCHQSSTKHMWGASGHGSATLSCADCHKAHDATDKVLRAGDQQEICFTCHQTQKANSLKPYAHPIRQGEMACSSCHEPHGSTTRNALKGATVNETCYSCHPDLRGPFVWEHAPVAEDCTLCHDQHGSIHPAMLKQRAPFLCQTCHSASGHPSVAYGPSGLPGGSAPSPAVVAGSCTNCHVQVHGSNHPSGRSLTR
jgi:DmsE family decaheme c-type cytochrome